MFGGRIPIRGNREINPLVLPNNMPRVTLTFYFVMIWQLTGKVRMVLTTKSEYGPSSQYVRI